MPTPRQLSSRRKLSQLHSQSPTRTRPSVPRPLNRRARRWWSKNRARPTSKPSQASQVAGRPTATRAPGQKATSLSDKVIPTAFPVADKDKAINRKASQPPGKAPFEQKPAPALDQTKPATLPAAGRPTAARLPGEKATSLSEKVIPTALPVADKDKAINRKASQPPGKAPFDQTKPAAGRPTAVRSPGQKTTSLSDKVIPTALPVADKDKAINRKASQQAVQVGFRTVSSRQLGVVHNGLQDAQGYSLWMEAMPGWR